MKERLFTKSAFKVALTCPTQLYYSRNPEYTNQSDTDEFLQALAEGGFQVGELAKVYYGIEGPADIKSLDYDESIRQTRALFESSANVNIAESAFRYGRCFVRVDILQKVGSTINLIEVKAKSWNNLEDNFTDKRDPSKVASGIQEYVYDAAFQKYVVTNALKQLYPDKNFTVHAFLMMADKTKVAPVDGINQCFRIAKDGGRTHIIRTPQAAALRDVEHILTPFDIDSLCNQIIAGHTTEQPAIMGMPFGQFVDKMSTIYCDNLRVDTPVGAACIKCPFYNSGTDTAAGRDGRHECFRKMAHFTDSDFQRPSVFDLNGSGIKRGNIIAGGTYFLDQVDESQIKVEPGPGCLSSTDRKWLHIGMATGNPGILARFAGNIHDGAYIDIDGLSQEMSGWTFPLHMIDFETTTVALPFYKGLRPYQDVAFQFSHHIIDLNPDGTYSIRHAGQFINTEKGHFPNFDFVRELKRQLEQDGGTIFRYAAHENSILRHISQQLQESREPDAPELMDFIAQITQYKERSKTISGPRNMVDMLELVKRYYYHPSMKGSNSIKAVLPAVLNSSRFLQQKYSHPIYGTEIPSLNIPATAPIAWINLMADGHTVENPYHLLPSVSTYIDVPDSELDREPDYDDMTICHGGAALTAYSKLQFSDTAQSEALSKALLRYCELDTMAMVFIWEYFNNMISNN